MSGFLPAVATLGGAVQTATSLAGRNDLAAAVLFGASGPISIGGIGLHGFEVPERVVFGGRQQMTVPILPGGQRFINAMGRDDDEIRWEGIMLSTDAQQRAQALDAMRVAGAAVPLSWGSYYFTVVIAAFEAEYRQPGWIAYRIRCAVLQDMSWSPGTGPISAAVQIYEDLSTAAGTVALLFDGPSGFTVPTATPAQMAAAASALSAAQTAAQAAAQANYQLGSASYDLAVSSLATASASTLALRQSADATTAALAAAASNGIADTPQGMAAAWSICLVAALADAARVFAARAALNAATGAT